MEIGARGEIHVWLPTRPGNGTSQHWQRTINGTPYAFTRVVMPVSDILPDGEIRWIVRKFVGADANDMRFDCDWRRVHSITFPATNPTKETTPMTDYQNSATVTVDALSVGDAPMTIGIVQIGGTLTEPARYAYNVTYDGTFAIAGSDLYGPASGTWPEAADMAVTLGSFLGATWECGRLTEHGASYPVDQQVWLETHAERLSVWAAMEQEQDEPLSDRLDALRDEYRAAP